MSVLHIDSVTKSYNDNVVLSDIFLSCKIGEIKGLIGRNGAGKSTLLKIVFGSEKADYKFVRIGTKIIKNRSDGRNLINYLPQTNFLPNSLPIKTLIKLFLPKKESSLLMNNPLIKPLLNKKNQNLSGGEKRRIEIFLLLYSKAKFLLLDEPFKGISPIERSVIINTINSIKSTKGIIITDHDYKSVIDIADQLVFLKDGFLRKVNNKDELKELGYLPKH